MVLVVFLKGSHLENMNLSKASSGEEKALGRPYWSLPVLKGGL